MSDIQIYIADLAAYNNGILHGAWIDATQDIDDIQDQINRLLKNSPEPFAEEYAIHDYEGFCGISIHEYEGITSAHKKAAFIEEHGELGAQVASHFGDDLEGAEKALSDAYIGEYTSLEDYAQQLTEDCSEVPEHLAYYIDYDRMGRDMDMSGDIFHIEISHDQIHVFSNF